MSTVHRSFATSGFGAVRCLLAAGLAGCVVGGPSRVDPWDLVPLDSPVVLHLDWPLVQANDALRAVIRDSGVDRALGLPGIETVEIATLVAFSDLVGGQEAGGAAIVKGRFDRAALARQVADRGYRERTYRTQQVYVDFARQVHATLLASDVIVVGARAAVERVIDTKHDAAGRFRRQPHAAALLRTIGTGKSPVSMLVVLPPSYQDAGTAVVDLSSTVLGAVGLEPLGTLLERIGLPGALALGLSASGAEYTVELSAEMQDEHSATLIAGGLSLLRSLSGLLPALSAPETPSGPIGGVRDLTVAREGSRLSLTMKLGEKHLIR